MSGSLTAKIVDRRTFVIGAAHAGMLLGSLSLTGSESVAQTEDKRAPYSAQFEAAYREIIGSVPAGEGLISLTLPDHFDNGHAVPFSISVDSEMSRSSYISDIYMVSTANPVARVARFHLNPECGAAIVSGRFRLARSQDVYVLARRNDGALFVAKQLVTVAVGGCS